MPVQTIAFRLPATIAASTFSRAARASEPWWMPIGRLSSLASQRWWKKISAWARVL